MPDVTRGVNPGMPAEPSNGALEGANRSDILQGPCIGRERGIMARACPSIAEHRRAMECPDLSRQKTEEMSLQHISLDI
eukprot:2419187-Prorocentrum_lima.AAC.1